jgi:NAD(P)-dependent dehydrogenase (short-subunit alcohol dehydrogenase family)
MVPSSDLKITPPPTAVNLGSPNQAISRLSDLDGTGVTVNVLVPGGVTNTPMISDEAESRRKRHFQEGEWDLPGRQGAHFGTAQFDRLAVGGHRAIEIAITLRSGHQLGPSSCEFSEISHIS